MTTPETQLIVPIETDEITYVQKILLDNLDSVFKAWGQLKEIEIQEFSVQEDSYVIQQRIKKIRTQRQEIFYQHLGNVLDKLRERVAIDIDGLTDISRLILWGYEKIVRKAYQEVKKDYAWNQWSLRRSIGINLDEFEVIIRQVIKGTVDLSQNIRKKLVDKRRKEVEIEMIESRINSVWNNYWEHDKKNLKDKLSPYMK